MRRLRTVVTILATGAAAMTVGLAGAPAAMADGDTPKATVNQIEGTKWPTLQRPDTHWRVDVVENLLVEYAGFPADQPDESFGEDTTEYVKDYEEKKGLDVNGVVEKETWEAFQEDLGEVGEGAKGQRVEAIQFALVAGYGYDIEIDGVYGGSTVKAVESFQEKAGIGKDGITGPLTFEALVKGIDT